MTEQNNDTKYFILTHPSGNRRALIINNNKIIDITSCGTKEFYDYIATGEKVILVDRTLNSCPFIYDDKYYATYCKINGNNPNTVAIDCTDVNFRDLIAQNKNKNIVLIYATNIGGTYWPDTVFYIVRDTHFLKGEGDKGVFSENPDNPINELVRSYHFSDTAINSHEWKIGTFDKKITLISTEESFLPMNDVSTVKICCHLTGKMDKLIKKKVNKEKKKTLSEIEYPEGLIDIYEKQLLETTTSKYKNYLYEIDKKTGKNIISSYKDSRVDKISIDKDIKTEYFDFIVGEKINGKTYSLSDLKKSKDKKQLENFGTINGLE